MTALVKLIDRRPDFGGLLPHSGEQALNLLAGFKAPSIHSPSINFQRAVKNPWLGERASWADIAAPHQSQNIEGAPPARAHLNAMGQVVERRWDHMRQGALENLALASYALPLPEHFLPPSLVQARTEMHESFSQMADATRTGLHVFEALHPINLVTKSQLLGQSPSPVMSHLTDLWGAMTTYLQKKEKQFGDWFTSDNKLTPEMTAWLVDQTLSIAMFAMTKKVGPNSTLGAVLDIEKIQKPKSKTLYRVKGTNVQFSVQRDVTVKTNLSLNIKDLRISLDPSKSPKTYALLERVIHENPGQIKMVSATVPVDAAMRDALLKGADKPIQAGMLKDTQLGKLLQAEGLGGKVRMILRNGESARDQPMMFMELNFTRA